MTTASRTMRAHKIMYSGVFAQLLPFSDQPGMLLESPIETVHVPWYEVPDKGVVR